MTFSHFILNKSMHYTVVIMHEIKVIYRFNETKVNSVADEVILVLNFIYQVCYLLTGELIGME